MAGSQGRSEPHEHRREHGQNLAQVGGQKKDHRFSDILINAAPLLDGFFNGGKIIVRQDDLGGLLRHIRPALPHGDADIRGLQGRRVVHPVAGHRHNPSLFLKALHDPYLGLGRDAGKYPHIVQRPQKFPVGEPPQLLFRHALLPALYDPQPGGDRIRRIHMIPGDHHCADPGPAEAFHRSCRLRPGRILHSDHADKGKLPLLRPPSSPAHGHGQRPQPLA